MRVKIDLLKLRDSNINIDGWVLPKNLNEKPKYSILDSKGNIIKSEINYLIREDLIDVFKLKINNKAYFGFNIVFPYKDEEIYTLNIECEKENRKIKISKDIVLKQNSVDFKRKKFLYSFFTKDNIINGISFLLREGPDAFMKKLKSKFEGKEFDYDYDEWYRLTKISVEEIKKQRKYKFAYEPKYSIVIPVYDTNEEFLKLLLDSIFNQTYTNFEVCIADATDYNSTHNNNPKNVLEEYKKTHNNLIVSYLGKNLGIANNTNEAIKLSTAEFIVLCDHDDELTQNALYECTKCLNEHKDTKIIYSDEDKIDLESKTYFEPHFKSDFNLDLLLQVNYFCHLFVVKKELLESICEEPYVYERNEYDGAQDYDLFLRLVNALIPNNVNQIKHIPKVLYHWRCHKFSTAKAPETKLYAFNAGIKALEDFYKHTKINFPKIKKIENTKYLGFYKTTYDIENEELISVIIPNKDHTQDLHTAITSMMKGNYKKLEFIVVENNSVEKETFEYYEKIQKDFNNVKVVYWDKEFNYSQINNFGVKYASGEYILFANNDIEMKNKNSIYSMFSYILRDDVGIVGAKLLYSDDTIQHAGVCIGMGGIAGHLFIGIDDYAITYMHRSQTVCDYSAVTAACLMTKKSLVEQVGGFSEELKVAFNDIDFCLKVRELNKLVVYNPYATFYHYESKTRGLEDTVEKIQRFNSEILTFAKKWGCLINQGDPYYNPNFTLRKSNYALRDLHYEKIGEPFKLDLSIEKQLKQAEEYKKIHNK